MSIHVSDNPAFPVLTLKNAHGEAKVALFGGHVISYIPSCDNQERIWISENALLDGSKAIRGGIPVCWPWFSDDHGQALGSLPSHGFVRTQHWTLTRQSSTHSEDWVVLVPGTTTGPGFNAKAKLELRVSLAERLHISLCTTNLDQFPFKLGCALHTYFKVDEISTSSLRGLTGQYKDKTRDWAILPTPDPYIFTQETDRVHLTPATAVEIERPPLQPIEVSSEGHDSVVVWNPWAENAKAMTDMTNEGYKHMLCVETALTQGYSIQPGDTHTLTQVIR